MIVKPLDEFHCGGTVETTSDKGECNISVVRKNGEEDSCNRLIMAYFQGEDELHKTGLCQRHWKKVRLYGMYFE